MAAKSSDVRIPIGDRHLNASWAVPKRPRGVIVFAHGSGSSRFSPRNQEVAEVMQDAGFATLLMDMLDEFEAADRSKVFDIELLAQRLIAGVEWVVQQPKMERLPIGLFGASTGAAAALRAAALRPGNVDAVVSRGGRPDLAWGDLPHVKAPTLLIVGQRDYEVLKLNQSVLPRLRGVRELRTVPGATHLFEEPGTLARAADLARHWFLQHLAGQSPIDDPYAQLFVNREQAGQRLVERLSGRSFTDPLVLAIPRGGVVVGAVLAEGLGAELDVILARKLRMPGQPEFALGAISEEGDLYLNPDTEAMSEQMQEYLDQECRQQMEEIERRRDLLRQGRPPASVTGRSVIVTDDGIATGSTMIAALRALKTQKPREVIVAAPVAAPDRLRQVERECDEAVCLIETPLLHAVGQFYLDFAAVEDEEVVALLKRFAARAQAVEQ
jgi:predicted phosphoribosyltransferase/dienelactone hydrolase